MSTQKQESKTTFCRMHYLADDNGQLIFPLKKYEETLRPNRQNNMSIQYEFYLFGAYF